MTLHQVSWPLPLYSPAISIMWAVIYLPPNSLSWEISWEENYWKKYCLLLSQLRDLNLFRPMEHLDSSVCPLLTLEEWAASWIDAHKHIGRLWVRFLLLFNGAMKNEPDSPEPADVSQDGPAVSWSSGAWLQCQSLRGLVPAAGASSLTNATLSVCGLHSCFTLPLPSSALPERSLISLSPGWFVTWGLLNI